LQVPAGPVETLLVPAQGSWMELCEAIDFVRAVRPARAFPIHDGQLNERGMGSVNAWFTREGGMEYRWLAPGEAVT
jgi:hypothetical protein